MTVRIMSVLYHDPGIHNCPCFHSIIKIKIALTQLFYVGIASNLAGERRV